MSDRARTVPSVALGIVMIIVGGLLTLFFGGCALAFTVLTIVTTLQEGEGFVAILVIAVPVGLGLLIAVGGVVLIRRGTHRL